ncbi:MAG TPA: GNAT family N-acetyltransferase, partial [Tistrella mobilis]|nr:GNAT family N-acetyltransferase [Tistrella mobilis]
MDDGGAGRYAAGAAVAAPGAPAARRPAIAIRDATLADIDALLAIENASFVHDRISRRSFRHLLTRAHADTVIAETAGADGRMVVAGYAMVLYNTGTRLARLYSIATAPGWRGAGIGGRLLAEVEARSRAAEATTIRLEVRADAPDVAAIYEHAGYRRFGRYVAYYEDAVDAIRMEKSLARRLDPSRDRVPYVEQSLPFTCGPAALIMAM